MNKLSIYENHVFIIFGRGIENAVPTTAARLGMLKNRKKVTISSKDASPMKTNAIICHVK